MLIKYIEICVYLFNLKYSKTFHVYRFANNDFEVNDYTEYLHDDENHGLKLNILSQLQYVRVEGAGVLHNELSPAVMMIGKSPYINSINVTNSASHGISVITFKHQNIHLFSNWLVITLLSIHFVIFIM